MAHPWQPGSPRRRGGQRFVPGLQTQGPPRTTTAERAFLQPGVREGVFADLWNFWRGWSDAALIPPEVTNFCDPVALSVATRCSNIPRPRQLWREGKDSICPWGPAAAAQQPSEPERLILPPCPAGDGLTATPRLHSGRPGRGEVRTRLRASGAHGRAQELPACAPGPALQEDGELGPLQPSLGPGHWIRPSR